jgi:hypothetical protein
MLIGDDNGGLAHKGTGMRGPSRAVRAWALFLEERADWFIDARKRWHDGDPLGTGFWWRLILGFATALLAAWTLVERVLGG